LLRDPRANLDVQDVQRQRAVPEDFIMESAKVKFVS
jgi:hypothetical protein